MSFVHLLSISLRCFFAQASLALLEELDSLAAQATPASLELQGPQVLTLSLFSCCSPSVKPERQHANIDAWVFRC